ncbi:MAG: hypothetical protein OHK0032_09400 [Thermodesulfovibrionales bacterium]
MEKFRRVSLVIVAIALLTAIMISPVMAADKGIAKGVAKGSLLSKTDGFRPAVTYIMASAGTPGTGTGGIWTPLPGTTYPTPGNRPK